jgi:asparagine synthase (glutamine-hydrolysing)
MCGIFSLLNNCNTFAPVFVDEQFQKGRGRGPEFSKLSHVGIKISMGFHRLSINGLNPASNQPLVDGDITLICNGEIYNYKELYRYMNVEPKTESDCEVIIHLYKKYGIQHTLQMLDGVFSFVLLDSNINSEHFKLYVARDPYGVRPLYILYPNASMFVDEKDDREEHHIVGFASELKVLYPFYSLLNQMLKKKKSKKTDGFSFGGGSTQSKYILKQFPPGSFSYYTLSSKVLSVWTPEIEYQRYHSTGFNSLMYHSSPQYYDSEIILNIQRYLIRAIEKRCCTTERPIACLLSGGLDSSIITGLVRQYHVTHELPLLETYSIGLEGSEDLKYAKMVAEHLGTKHTEIVLTETDFLEAIPEVIHAIESYDTTTVRASIGNYLIGKYISKNSDAKVIFNGDGSDELCGGYLYMYLANESVEFDCEVRRLLEEIHIYDVLRSDKSISSHGLEPRTPFLDRSFVQYYLSIPPQMRFHTRNDQCEKYLLRMAFSNEHYRNSANEPLLPNEVLWRTKEAFSDGVSHKSRSLYQIIQEYANQRFEKEYSHKISKYGPNVNLYSEIAKEDDIMKDIGTHLIPTTAEQFMYRKIFESHYSGMGKLIPRFWMPKYADNIVDPSARTLDIYNDSEEPAAAVATSSSSSENA